MSQNFSNHTRYIPLWHFITGTLVIALPGGAIVNLFHSTPDTHYANALLVVVSLVLLTIFWYARWFALRAQDRAIRAEENLRHFVLTGKRLDKSLRTGQIVALRFAADEEMPALAQKAVDEKLSPKQIKQLVQNWKADYHRV
jgi:cbb3-type cytochrome oxidase subunit 3